jgi:hypothetical protein
MKKSSYLVVNAVFFVLNSKTASRRDKRFLHNAANGFGKVGENAFTLDLPVAIGAYEERDARRCINWREIFSHLNS